MVTINLNFNNFSELPILSEVFGSFDNSYEYTADEIFRKKASPFWVPLQKISAKDIIK